MATVPPGDPRVAANGGESNVAPVVALPRGGPSWIVIAIGMAILGVLLFSVLDSRRRAAEVPAVRASAADRLSGTASAAPPALYVPPAPAPPPPAQVVTVQAEPVRQLPAPPPQIIYVPQPAPPQPQPQVVEAPPQRASNAPALVYDGSGLGSDAGAAPPGPGATATPGAADNAGAGATPSLAGTRARAGVLANRTSTVPQGTLIPAVLETGLDSTRPGLARAMVTRDVRGFDGTRILIPRGSRLIGEYRTDASTGQKRAMVNWTRLIRPDGVTIAIGSPASDPLGRGGIGAKVNNHFFARFAGAILQSTLDLGVTLATRGTNYYSPYAPLIVGLPGTVQNVTQPLQQNDKVTPTLTVKPGTSITIFVARDLDFSGAGGRR